jgi:hypothetical protein
MITKIYEMKMNVDIEQLERLEYSTLEELATLFNVKGFCIDYQKNIVNYIELAEGITIGRMIELLQSNDKSKRALSVLLKNYSINLFQDFNYSLCDNLFELILEEILRIRVSCNNKSNFEELKEIINIESIGIFNVEGKTYSCWHVMFSTKMGTVNSEYIYIEVNDISEDVSKKVRSSVNKCTTILDLQRLNELNKLLLNKKVV